MRFPWAALFAKIDNTDAKVTGCASAKLWGLWRREGREEKTFLYLFTVNTYQTDIYYPWRMWRRSCNRNLTCLQGFGLTRFPADSILIINDRKKRCGYLYLVLFIKWTGRSESGKKKSFYYYLLIIRVFLCLIKTFLKNNTWKVCRIQKKPYLCIAFETEVYGRLAQLVQSICLTSRGSAVRIRQRPL